jgi:hypothetical protein
MKLLGVHVQAEIVTDAAPFAVKGAAGLHIDGAGGRAGIHVGTRRAMNFDRFDRADRERLETRRAAEVAGAVGIGTGERHAVERDTNVLRIHATEARAAGLGLDVIDVDAGQVFEELADVAVSDIAEDIGRD